MSRYKCKFDIFPFPFTLLIAFTVSFFFVIIYSICQHLKHFFDSQFFLLYVKMKMTGEEQKKKKKDGAEITTFEVFHQRWLF